eukprot:9027427-Pyramimonas_sp.AAC.1
MSVSAEWQKKSDHVQPIGMTFTHVHSISSEPTESQHRRSSSKTFVTPKSLARTLWARQK